MPLFLNVYIIMNNFINLKAYSFNCQLIGNDQALFGNIVSRKRFNFKGIRPVLLRATTLGALLLRPRKCLYNCVCCLSIGFFPHFLKIILS